MDSNIHKPRFTLMERYALAIAKVFHPWMQSALLKVMEADRKNEEFFRSVLKEAAEKQGGLFMGLDEEEGFEEFLNTRGPIQ